MSRRTKRQASHSRLPAHPAPAANSSPKPGAAATLWPWTGGWLPWLLLFGATLLAYQPIWHAGFIWDDGAHVTRPDLLSFDGLRQIWLEPGATQQYYPVLHTAFWVEHHLWGEPALGYHLANLLFHFAATFLFFRVLRRLAVPGALLAAAAFALHPVGVETVAWISEQKNTLSAIFYFAAVLSYLDFDRERRPRQYVAATLLFLLALGAKTVTGTLPAGLLVVFWWKRGRLNWRGDVLPLLPWFALSVVAGVTTAWMEQSSIGATGEAYALGWIGRVLVAGRAVWFYLAKLAAPLDLVFIYPRWQIDTHVAWQYLFPAALIALVAVLFLRRTLSRGPLAALLLFVGTLFPALGFINVFPFAYSFVADHFQYLASALLIAAVVASAAARASRLPAAGQTAARFAAVAMLGSFAALTWRQSETYVDSETLWRTTIARNPDCWMAYNNLGADLLQDGRLAEGLPLVERAVEIAPSNPAGHSNLGTARQMQGRMPEAIGEFEKALALDRNNAEAETNLAAAQLLAGQKEAAEVHLHRALTLNPNFAKAHLTLGNLLLQSGQVGEAVERYRQAVKLDPRDLEARTNLGTALAQQGKYDEAVTAFHEVLLLRPKSAPALFNLGNALLQSGHLDSAIAHFRRALEIEPNAPLTRNNLGLALLQASHLEEAAAQFRAALALSPDYAEAHRNLGTVLFKLGRVDEADAQFQAGSTNR